MFKFENNVTPVNDTNLNKMQVELLKDIFPVGSTYITQSANINPNTILGFGTWARLKGKVVLGVDEDDDNLKTTGATGGEKEHTLTVDELPSHFHEGIYQNDNNWSGFIKTGSGSGTIGYQAGTAPIEGANVEMRTGSVGSGLPVNNMMPYEVVGYMWIRRS